MPYAGAHAAAVETSASDVCPATSHLPRPAGIDLLAALALTCANPSTSCDDRLRRRSKAVVAAREERSGLGPKIAALQAVVGA